ncbi:KxYKxGKxW signal peptide domain-containing protein [Enterococcus cecorum]|uniref:Extracellular matrix-binding protein ebh GA module domain-containing protein n=1 Tax=Enterococcus cecorum TaxID=44008 RepID=A0A366SED4_9ENTE|nr:KxYKxGKxW signal peptide domain-containing protein [Enterococcus cecorum]RBR27478.1 hypothetical protein EB18_02165 [Enterococcus cecorum]
MKNNKNVRKDNLSPVDNSTKRVYKMYKSKKNWVVAPVVLLTLLGAVAPAPIALSNVSTTVLAAEADLTGFVKDAYNKINALPVSELKDSDKKDLLDSFTTTTKEDEALTKLQDAYKKVADTVAASVDFAKAEQNINALTKVDKASYLTKVNNIKSELNKAVDTFKSDVNTKVTKDTDKYSELKATLDAAVSKAKTDLAAVVADAQNADKVNGSFDLKKADSLSQISKLTYLNATQVADFTKQVNAVANDKDYVANFDTIVSAAKAANQKYVDAAKKVVSTELAKLHEGDTKKALTEKYNKVTTVEAANSLLTEVKAAVAAQELADAKATAKTTINEFVPTDSKYAGEANKSKLASLKADYVKKVDAATSVDEVNNVVTAFKAEATGLEDIKVAAKQSVEALANISAVDKANYAYAIDHSTSKEAVDALLADAKAKDAKNLSDAKAAAKEAINGKEYLSAEAKKDLVSKVDEAKTVTAVNDLVDSAKNQDETAKKAAELATAQKDALAVLDGLKSFSDVQTYKDQVKNAKSVDDVKSAVEAAKAAYEAVLAAETDAAKAKTEAKELVSALNNLTEAEKAQAVKDIDSAKTVAEVKDTFNSAKELDNTNKVAAEAAAKLAEAKKAAVDSLKKDAYLTDAAKADFTNKINAAKDKAELDKVKAEIDKASKAAKATAEALDSAIKDANQTIDGLTKLTEVQKYEFKIKALNSKTPEEAKNVKLEAQLKDLAQTTDKAAYISKAKALLFTAEAQNGLTKAQKDAYSAAIDNAKTIEDAKKLIDEAVAKAATQSDAETTAAIDKLLAAGYVNQAKVKLAELRVDANKEAYTAKVNAAAELVAAKLAAQDVVNKADYVPAKDKAGYIAKIEAAKSVDEVNKVLDEVNQLAPAKAVQLYRAYNPNSGEHLYTANKAEYDHLVKLGWHGEGNAWKAADKGTPVYRLYNPNSGEHFYTTSKFEYDSVAKAGWNKEGVAFYSDAKRGVEVYRLFNPNAKGAGSHHYTTSAGERDSLMAKGWKYENIAFYGLK